LIESRIHAELSICRRVAAGTAYRKFSRRHRHEIEL